MTEISTLAILQQLDRLRLKENPYNAHTLADKDENSRRHYCALLFMAMLSHSSISEDQQRMLQLWLPAIGMEGRQAELCQLAIRLGEEGVEEALNAVRNCAGQICFLLDCLVFCRVNGPITTSQTALLEALAAMLDISQEEMENVVYIACLILGLPVGEKKASELLLGMNEIRVWREFLTDYIELLFVGLKSWVSENYLYNLITTDNINSLLKIDELDLYSNDWKVITPFPTGLSLLENLHSLRFDSYNIKNFPAVSSLPGKLSFIRVGSYGEISLLPDAICRLTKLTSLQIPEHYLSGISESVYQFLRNNNVQHNIPDSCFIKGPK
ncbi:hypothetical protein FR773_06725 [Leclercia adecarboxylata]|uniref:hypothetical protein n=1 Tax=Leclercia adecarboxylata TaxID=83655 RepID=UPI0012A7CCB9|nr:hypothetical protein [Leclercia adecarboxylata]QFH64430.1 hypothetical protein FR773_06725 [Leclercia adecarboxylata]QGP83002.1 hypothetical protein GLX29_06800 [Leclercia adecarboxylata]